MSPALAPLLDARVRGVHAPARDLLVLELALAGGDAVVLALSIGQTPGLGVIDARPKGLPAEGVAKRLRNELEGAVLRAVLVAGPAIAFDLTRSDADRGLVLELGPRAANVILLDDAGVIAAALDTRALGRRRLALGQPWEPPEGEALALPQGLSELRDAGRALFAARREAEAAERVTQLIRALRKELARMQRRVRATEGDLDRAREAPRLRAMGNAIVAGLHAIPHGASEVELPDYSGELGADGEPPSLRVPLDPARGPKGTAEEYFRRARRLERGQEMARARHQDALGRVSALMALLEQAAAPATTLDALEGAARALGVGAPNRTEPKRGARAREPAERCPYRAVQGSAGREIRVGRGAADNDQLTFHHSKSWDLWLHAKGGAGAHVIVPLRKGENCPAELLVDAATLAAHHSQLRGEERVEVLYAPRGRVRKPKGARPGSVRVDQPKTLVVRVEPARLARLEPPDHVALPPDRSTEKKTP